MDLEDDYEDEPMTSAVRANEFSGNQLVIENMDDVERKRRKRRKKRRKRLERLGKLAVCVCVVGTIVAIVLVVVLTEATIAATAPLPPTVAPTEMPVVPTRKPTIAHPTPTVPTPTNTAPAPVLAEPTVPATAAPTEPLTNEVTLKANQDTYIYLDGKDQAKSFGKEETFLVQTGFRTNDSIAKAVGLLIFDTSRIPSFDELPEDGKTATLKLFHEPLDITEQNREPAPVQISRLPSNTELILESVNGGSYDPRDGREGPIVEVPTEAAEVSVDITDLVFSQPLEGNQLFLLLETVNQEQETGDRFFSRESDTPPELIVSGLKP